MNNVESASRPSPVRIERAGAVALVVTDNPPVNALSVAVRRGLVDAITAAAASDAETIVLICDGPTFFSGADIAELDRGVQPPGLLEVEAACRTARQPVVAAMHGSVLGGGMVIGYCADHRVAAQATRFGMPEVKLGLLATFGGTQFLPRLLGLPVALDLLLDGEPIDAVRAHAIGFVDLIVPRAVLREESIARGRQLARGGSPKRPVRSLPLAGPRDALLAALDTADRNAAERFPGWTAPRATIAALRAGVVGGLEAGLHEEARLFENLRTSRQSATLRRLFFAMRALARSPLSADVARRLLDSAGRYAPGHAAEQRGKLHATGTALLCEGLIPSAAIGDAAIVATCHWPAWDADILSAADHAPESE